MNAAHSRVAALRIIFGLGTLAFKWMNSYKEPSRLLLLMVIWNSKMKGVEGEDNACLNLWAVLRISTTYQYRVYFQCNFLNKQSTVFMSPSQFFS